MRSAIEIMLAPMQTARFKRFLTAISLLIAIPTVSWAQDERSAHSRTGSSAVAVKPIYNPHTKSYFELRVDLPWPPPMVDCPQIRTHANFQGCPWSSGGDQRCRNPQFSEGEFRTEGRSMDRPPIFLRRSKAGVGNRRRTSTHRVQSMGP